MAEFGEILAELRQDHKLTQQQLGEKIFVSAATISNYESGAHYPDVQKLISLANFFHVTTDYLLGRCTSSLSPDVFKQALPMGMTIGDFVKDFQSLPADRQAALLLIMKDLKLGQLVDHYMKRG